MLTFRVRRVGISADRSGDDLKLVAAARTLYRADRLERAVRENVNGVDRATVIADRRCTLFLCLWSHNMWDYTD